MIKQANKGLNSRNEANPFLTNGKLPLMTAPMYSVVDDKTYSQYLDSGIHVCLPRNVAANRNNEVFESFSLNDFISIFIDRDENGLLFEEVSRVCIDVANGNMPKLHQAIRTVKDKFDDKVIIIAGNVSSSEAFIELAKTGVDYIRVGIGGGAGCNTTMNTGVGQEHLELLIKECYAEKYNANLNLGNNYKLTDQQKSEYYKIGGVKIIADGISTYINQLVEKKQGLDNGYAAINRLLYAGADIVMIGRLFAQSLESAGEKTESKSMVNYYGMSTQKAQKQYSNQLKHSEGNEQWIPVKWKLRDWINGDGSDYLPGFVNCLKSAMSYAGSETLNDFKSEI